MINKVSAGTAVKTGVMHKLEMINQVAKMVTHAHTNTAWLNTSNSQKNNLFSIFHLSC